MIITVVGGGSTFTPGIVKSIAQRAKELNLMKLDYLILIKNAKIRWLLLLSGY